MSRQRRVLAWSGATLATVIVAVLQIRRIDALRDQGHFDKYLDFARRAVSGSLEPSRVPDFSPGYAWLVTLLHGYAGLDVFAIRALQIALVPVAALAVAVAAERVGGAMAACVASLCVIGSRAALLNATELEPESWILFLGAIGLVPLMRERISGHGAFLAGFAFGLSAIFRPSAILIVLALLAWLAWRERRCAAMFVAAAAVPVLVILLVNARLTGTAIIMDPGTVFYEGMNPLAIGYSGVQPRIVNDLEKGRGVDALHVTYRLVAARALGQTISTNASNRYWTAKAIAFVETHPLAAFRLTARKLAAAVSSHDPWDLVTVVRKERELSAVAVPFGYVFALSIAGLWLGDRQRLVPVALALVCAIVPMCVFYVTARQRNAAIPAAAILAGCAVAAALRNRRAAIAFGCALAAGAFLTIETDPAKEDRHQWRASGREAMLFDAALRLEHVHQWSRAEQILASLADAGYRPERRNETTSSISYHLARTRLRQRRAADYATLLANARAEAPGDPDVLALSGPTFEGELARLHDPFTAELSRVRAMIDAGRMSEASARGSALMQRIPEWNRPAETLRTW